MTVTSISDAFRTAAINDSDSSEGSKSANKLIKCHRHGSNVLFISNLPPEIALQDLLPLLGTYGVVEACTHSKEAGYAFAKMSGRFAVNEVISHCKNQLIKDLFPHLMGVFKEKLRRVDFQRANCQGDILTPLVHDERWSEHISPDGTSYYYDCMTGVSQWSLPPVLGIASVKADTASNCPFQHAGPIIKIENQHLVLTPSTQLTDKERECTIFVGLMPVTWGHSEINAVFCRFGTIINSWLQRDSEEKSRGYGYVQFKTPHQAKIAQQAMDRYHIDFRTLCAERMRVVTSYIKKIRFFYVVVETRRIAEEENQCE